MDLALPPEIWSLIIENIEDHCFAWYVLRRVSKTLRQITEDAFARYIIQDCSVALSGENAINLFPQLWSRAWPLSGRPVEVWHIPHVEMLNCRFIPSLFSPANTKDNIILQINRCLVQYNCNPVVRPIITKRPTRKPIAIDQFMQGEWTSDGFSIRRQPCNCPTLLMGHTARCSCLPDTYTDPNIVKHFKSLNVVSHFVRLNGQLKSIRLYPLAMNENGDAISLDWRALCQTFYLDELQVRRAARPWLRSLMLREQNEPGYISKTIVDRIQLDDIMEHRWIS